MTVALQRKEVASLQSVVLENIPSFKQRPEEVKPFDTIPFMALKINAAELETLVNLVEVVSTGADRFATPKFWGAEMVLESK